MSLLIQDKQAYTHTYMHTREELLDITEDLFGPQQDALFSEFKTIIGQTTMKVKAIYGGHSHTYIHTSCILHFKCTYTYTYVHIRVCNEYVTANYIFIPT